LLIVGQQVINKEGGRSDLVAVDGEGNVVLIELKRDPNGHFSFIPTACQGLSERNSFWA
jgi:hypothetical protein